MSVAHYTIIRVCPEHLCKVFTLHRIWERAQAGEFRYEIESKRKTQPFVDHHGNINTWNDNLFVLDDAFQVGERQHQVALAHRHRTDTGVIGGSGLWDPKEILIHGINYRKFSTKGGREPLCELCERGDMVRPQERFYESRYRPKWSLWKRCWCWIRWARFRATTRL
jgi:hypothetical protein